MSFQIDNLTQSLQPLMIRIVEHPFYNEVTSISRLRLFMEQHVFAVWDFMCLLKALHGRIVATSVPWFPPKDALSANLISNILVEEEGDVSEDGRTYSSHYDIYLSAMEEVGADSKPIKQLIKLMQEGVKLDAAMELVPAAQFTKQFVATTFSFFDLKLHELAAAFVYGREAITSSMFLPMIAQLERKENYDDQHQLGTLIYYFKRHAELDDDDHFPKAIRMLSNLAGEDEKKIAEAEKAARRALQARVDFLDGLLASF